MKESTFQVCFLKWNGEPDIALVNASTAAEAKAKVSKDEDGDLKIVSVNKFS